MTTITTLVQFGGKKSSEFIGAWDNTWAGTWGWVNCSFADNDINFVFSSQAQVGETIAGVPSVNHQCYVAKRFEAAFKPDHTNLRFPLTGHNITKAYGLYFQSGRPEPSSVNKISRPVNFGAEYVITSKCSSDDRL